MYIRGDQISHCTKYGDLERHGQTFIPLCEKSFKTQHSRIPIDPAILAAIGHRYIAKIKLN